jgi:hypothetical protein
MKGSIIQPLFFPWAGYFHLIIRSEIFIFLDDAQFKKTWCARNKILIEGREKFINMQLMKQPQVTNINERKFYDFNQDFDNLKNTIFNAYRHNKFFSNIEELFFEIDKDLISVNLSEFNIYFIKRISKLMNIKTIFHQSSNLNINKKRSEKLIDLCKKFKINFYLSPEGSREYMEYDNFKTKFNGIIKFNNFFYKDYEQNYNGKFQSHLSILDLISNMSWQDCFNYLYCKEIKY